MTPDTPARITVRIDTLWLDGVPPGDRDRIGEAFRQELARLLGERLPAGLTQGGHVATLRAGQLTVPGSSRPDTTGASLARAVYAGFDRMPRGTGHHGGDDR